MTKGTNVGYKTIEDVEEKLNGELALPVSQRVGNGGMTFDYVAWTDSYRLLNEIFGIFGWTMSQPVVIFAAGVYTVSLAITVRVAGDEFGNAVEKTVAGVGQAVSRGDNDDNAAKAALSDALSRAVKMLGNAFGIGLYEKKGATAAPARRDTVTTGAATGTGGKGPSPKQAKILLEHCGYTEDSLASAPFQKWKADLDAHFANRDNAF